MTIEYFNNERNVMIQDNIDGPAVYSDYNLTKFPYNKYTVQITPSGGNATIKASLDYNEWQEWDKGAVSSTTIDTCESVCGIICELTTATSCAITIWGHN